MADTSRPAAEPAPHDPPTVAVPVVRPGDAAVPAAASRTGPRHARRPNPAGPPTRGACSWTGVAIVPEQGDDAPVTGASTDLQLVVDGWGVAVRGGRGAPAWAVPWDGVAALVAAPADQSGSRRGIEVVVTGHDGRVRRLAVPVGRPGAAAARLNTVARRHGVHPDAPERSLPILAVAGVVLAVGAVVAVLLLAAGHVVHLHP